MPSLILTGHPCAGKTTFAKQLAAQALSHKSNLIKSTVIINEQSARPDKTIYECYANSTEEKLTRSALKSEFDKYVTEGDPAKLVILDSMNYIKGFRYELHCISKAAGQKHGVIWTLCKENVAKAWNEERRGETRNKKDGDDDDDDDANYYYSTEMMNELICRYEPPDQRNRWDRPLYRVDIYSTLQDEMLQKLGGANADKDLDADGDADADADADQTGRAAEEALNRSVYNMHSLSDAIRDTSQAKAVTSHKMVTSFRRKTAGSGFKRAGAGGSSGFKKKVEVGGGGGGDESKSESMNASPEAKESKVNTLQQASNTTATTVTITGKREVKNIKDLIEPILDSFLLDVEPLKEGLSTRIHTSANSNVLHDVDSISQETLNAFLSAQKLVSSLGGGNGGTISVKINDGSGSSSETYSMRVNRSVKVAELKRLRRQYIKYVSAHPPQDTSERGIAKSFLSYIENQI